MKITDFRRYREIERYKEEKKNNINIVIGTPQIIEPSIDEKITKKGKRRKGKKIEIAESFEIIIRKTRTDRWF